MNPVFLTVPDDLVEIAESAYGYFDELGYSVSIEESIVEYPYTPTLTLKRSPTRLIVDVANGVSHDVVRQWVAYGKSCTSDTRFALAIPAWVEVANDDQIALRANGVGVYLATSNEVVETLVPADLAVNIDLPLLPLYPNSVRKVLGSSFETIRRGQWREGFGEACVALENAAKEYLKAHVATGRIAFVSPAGRTVSYSNEEIDEMSMGQLKNAFGFINLPTGRDSQITAVLERVNPDRIREAHPDPSGDAEKVLRKNVRHQLWAIVSGVEQLVV